MKVTQTAQNVKTPATPKTQKKTLKYRYCDNGFTITLKVIVTLIYVWSCFFWAGVTILNFYINSPESSHLATGFLVGSLLMTASLVLMYLRFYILQLPFFFLCAAVYLVHAGEMIDVAHGTSVVFTPTFELRYMPVVAIIIISAALAMLEIWHIVSIRSSEKEKFNNSPSKSILDD